MENDKVILNTEDCVKVEDSFLICEEEIVLDHIERYTLSDAKLDICKQKDIFNIAEEIDYKGPNIGIKIWEKIQN